ncbi:MAG: sigma-54-dependent Fis family transcriptional regulator [Desulfovibrio sp.]|nr:sigma-54-dependent Fis family transcriptional regulator [Desulfovibrio sp.]
MADKERERARLALLLALPWATNGFSVTPVAALLGYPSALVEEVLHGLAAQGAAACVEGVWRYAGDPEDLEAARRKAAEAFLHATAPLPCSAAVRGLALACRGASFEAARVLLEEVRRLSFDAASVASLCLSMAVAVIERAPLEGMNEETRRNYVHVTIELADVSAYYCIITRAVCPTLDTAIISARRNGDTRSVAILHMVKAHMLTFAAFNLSEEADRMFQEGYEMGKSFGDRDMLEYVSTFLGFRHFVQGRFACAVRYLEQVRSGFSLPGMVSWWGLFYAMASAFVGLDRQGVGVLESCWRTAELRGDSLPAVIWRLHLALLLLMAGKQEAARAHLDTLRSTIREDALPFVRIRLLWAQAYAFYLEGALKAARDALERSARILQRLGTPTPMHHFPWLLGMLYAFRQAGLPEVPGFGFEETLRGSFEHPSLQVRASAWQIKGMMLLEEQGLAEEARAAFKQALNLDLAVGNQVEAARAKLGLARANMLVGRRRSAERLRAGAFAVHREYGLPEWPEGLSKPRGMHAGISAAKAPFGPRLREQEPVPQLSSPAEIHHLLISNLCRELRVEQGALFVLKDGDLVPLGCYNLSLLQLESPTFTRIRGWLLRESAAPRITRRGDLEGHALCMPLRQGETSYVIYLCSRYYAGELEAMGNASLRAAAEKFREHLYLAERWGVTTGSEPESNGDILIIPREDSGDMLTGDPVMLRLLHKLEQIAATDAPVLIAGETGVGKELLARQLHKHSGRKGPFVSVHPASMTETLFESAFFGHEKGSFTGASNQKIGFFELADHGTLFIDEVGEMPLSMQTKFLRVLQERCFIRVGGLREIHSNFRLVTATNRDLEKEAAAGTFRHDLYYRLSVVPVQVPPLRTRVNDAQLLAQHFLGVFMRKYQRQKLSLSRADMIKIASYPWPGNVRELENVIERAVILAGEGRLELSLTPPQGEGSSPQLPAELGPGSQLIAGWPSLDELERRYIKLVLAQTGGRIYGDNGAEAILGIGRSTLYAKIRRYGLKAHRYYE